MKRSDSVSVGVDLGGTKIYVVILNEKTEVIDYERVYQPSITAASAGNIPRATDVFSSVSSTLMKHFLITGIFSLWITQVAQAQAPIGSISDDITYSLFHKSDVLQPQQLSAHEGKLVVLFFFTPW